MAAGRSKLAVRKWPNGFENSVAWSPNGKTVAVTVDNTEAGGKYASLVGELRPRQEQSAPKQQKRWYGVIDLAWFPRRPKAGLILRKNSGMASHRKSGAFRMRMGRVRKDYE